MRVTLITGAASGLGWAMARHWAAAGDALVLADVNAAALTARVGELTAAGVAPERIVEVAGDLTHSDVIAHLVQTTRERFGRLDRLVNNAGITHRSPAHRTDPAVFRRVMAVDWQAPIELTLAALPLLREARGAIVTIHHRPCAQRRRHRARDRPRIDATRALAGTGCSRALRRASVRCCGAWRRRGIWPACAAALVASCAEPAPPWRVRARAGRTVGCIGARRLP